jgi:hypothetical protein
VSLFVSELFNGLFTFEPPREEPVDHPPYISASRERARNAHAFLGNWLRLCTNTFWVGGSFSITNALDRTQRRQFFRLDVLP